MRYGPEQKVITRKKIVDAAHKGFRRQGYDGLGVDSLTKEAGVTSGAFYKHFDSKADVFREAVELGVGEFQAAVEMFQAKHGDAWLDAFARFYLGEKRCSELGNSCALQSLTPEVARAGKATRESYQSALQNAAKAFAGGLPGSSDNDAMEAAWGDIALLIGGVALARAVQDPALADEIAEAVRSAIVE